MQELTEKIVNVAMPFLKQAEAELVDLNMRRYKNNITIELLVDRYQGGITLEECTRLNSQIGNALEVENFIQQHYILEVSSPGIDRPLKTEKDFLRMINKRVRVFLSEPVQGKIEYAGLVKGLEEGCIMIESHSITVKIPISQINKGQQIIDIEEGS